MAQPGGTGDKVKDSLRFSRLGDSIFVVLKGNFAQRMTVLSGLVMIAFPVVYHWKWGAVILAGWILCYLGLRDYEREITLHSPANRDADSEGQPVNGDGSKRGKKAGPESASSSPRRTRAQEHGR